MDAWILYEKAKQKAKAKVKIILELMIHEVITWEPEPKKFKRVHQALIELGAGKHEVYAQYRRDSRQRGKTLEELYTYEEFKDWLHDLYQAAAKKFHPDYHPSLTNCYTHKMAQINAAYEFAINWLERRKPYMKKY